MFERREVELIKKFDKVQVQVAGVTTNVGAAYVRHLLQYKCAEEGTEKHRRLGVTLAEERALLEHAITPQDLQALVAIIGEKVEEGYLQQSVRKELDSIAKSVKGAKNVAV